MTAPAIDPDLANEAKSAPVGPFDAGARFQAIYAAELGYVLATLRRLGVRPADLEDVAHDVFVAIYRHVADYDPSRPLRPWLFGFAYRKARDHRRLARHRYEVSDAAAEPICAAGQPDELVEEERMRRLVLEALDELELEKRGILVMHDIDGVRVPEIAKVLEIPLNTAYSRLRLARAAFEKVVATIVAKRGGSP